MIIEGFMSVTDVPAKIRTQHIPYTNIELYRYATFPGFKAILLSLPC
jgi:hypothetical protein